MLMFLSSYLSLTSRAERGCAVEMWKTIPCGEGGEGGNGREGGVVSTGAFGGGNGWEKQPKNPGDLGHL